MLILLSKYIHHSPFLKNTFTVSRRTEHVGITNCAAYPDNHYLDFSSAGKSARVLSTSCPCLPRLWIVWSSFPSRGVSKLWSTNWIRPAQWFTYVVNGYFLKHCSGRGWVAVTETIWPTKTEIFALWLSTESLLTHALEVSKCRGLVNGNRITWVTECPCRFVCSRCTWRLVRMDWNPWLTFSSLDKQIFHSIVFCIKCHCWKVSLNIYFWVIFYFRNIFSYRFCYFFSIPLFCLPSLPFVLSMDFKNLLYLLLRLKIFISLYIFFIFKLVFLFVFFS